MLASRDLSCWVSCWLVFCRLKVSAQQNSRRAFHACWFGKTEQLYNCFCKQLKSKVVRKKCFKQKTHKGTIIKKFYFKFEKANNNKKPIYMMMTCQLVKLLPKSGLEVWCCFRIEEKSFFFCFLPVKHHI